LADQGKVPGINKAWLSGNAGTTPNTRFRISTGPYVLLDGSPVASSYADLTNGSIDAPINGTENRTRDMGSNVWTNTLPNGARGGDFAFVSCGNWTDGTNGVFGNTGASNQPMAGWTTSIALDCNRLHRLYCVQQA
jgi:hypothetical protein